MAKVNIEAALDPASVAKLASDLNSLLSKLNTKAIPVNIQGATDINALRAKIEAELSSMNVKFPNLTKQVTADISKGVQDAFVQAINSGVAPKLGDIFKNISDSDAKMAFAQTKTVMDELATAADKTRLAMVQAFADANVPSSVLAPLLDNINAVDKGWDKAIEKVHEFAAVIPQAASSVQGMAKALNIPDVNASQILGFAKGNPNASMGQIEGFLTNQTDAQGKKLFDVPDLEKAAVLVKQISEYMVNIGKNKQQQQQTPLIDPETRAKREKQISDLASMSGDMPAEQRMKYIEALNQSLDVTEKDWNAIVTAMGAANKEAQRLNDIAATIQKVFKGLSDDAAKELATRISEIASDAQRFGKNMGDSSVKAQIHTAIQDIGGREGLSQKDINGMIANTDRLINSLGGAAQGTDGFTNAHRRLGSSLGLSMNLISQFGGVLTGMNPQLSLLTSTVYSALSAFSEVGVKAAGFALILKAVEMGIQKVATAEQIQIQQMVLEGRTTEDNRKILEQYYRAKETGGGFAPFGFVNTMSLEQAQGIMGSAEGAKVQGYLKENIGTVQDWLANQRLVGKAEDENAAKVQILNNLLIKRNAILTLGAMGKGGDANQQKKDLDEVTATITVLEHAWNRLAGSSEAVNALVNEQAQLMGAQTQKLNESAIAAQGAAKSEQELFEKYMQMRGISADKALLALRNPLASAVEGLTSDELKFAQQQAPIALAQARKDFAAQIDRTFKAEESKRNEIMFYAKLMVPPDEYDRIAAEFDAKKKALADKPIMLGVEFTQSLQAAFTKAGYGDVNTIMGNEVMKKLKLGNLEVPDIKKLLDPRDFDEYMSKMAAFDAQYSAIAAKSATVQNQRQQLSASLIEQLGIAKATIQPITEQGQAAQRAATAAERQAQVAQLPLNAQIKMNEEIRKFLTAQGDVATFNQTQLAGVMQIQNAYIDQYSTLQGISAAEQQAAQVATRRAFVEEAIGDALTMQLQTAIKKAEIEYQAGIQIRETQRSFMVNPATRGTDLPGGREGYYEQDRARAFWKFGLELTRTETEFNIQRGRTRMQFERQWERDNFLHNQTLNEQATEYHITRKRSEESFQIDMRRSYQSFMYDLEDAAAQNDAAAVVKLYRRYALERKAKEEDFNISQRRAQEDFDRQRALDALHYNQQREWSRMLFEEQQQWALQDYDRQREYRLRDYAIQEADAKIARDRQIEQNKFQQDEILHQAQVQAEQLHHQNIENLKLKAIEFALNRQMDEDTAQLIFDTYDRLYGEGDGSITKVMMEYFRKERTLLDTRNAAISDMSSGVKKSIEDQDKDLDALDKRLKARGLLNDGSTGQQEGGSSSGGSSTSATTAWVTSFIKGISDVFGGLGQTVADTGKTNTDVNRKAGDRIDTVTAAVDALTTPLGDILYQLQDVLAYDVAAIKNTTNDIYNMSSTQADYLRAMRDYLVDIRFNTGQSSTTDMSGVIGAVNAVGNSISTTNNKLDTANGNLDIVLTNIGRSANDLAKNIGYETLGHSSTKLMDYLNSIISPLENYIKPNTTDLKNAYAGYSYGGFYSDMLGVTADLDNLNRVINSTWHNGNALNINNAYTEAPNTPTRPATASTVSVTVTGDLKSQVSPEFETTLLGALTAAIKEATPATFNRGAQT